MSTSADPGASAPVREGFWRRHFFARSFDRKARWNDESPFAKRMRRYDAQFYALVIALGLPLMGWTVHDVSLPFIGAVTAYDIKITIAAFWFAVTHKYWGLELDEIRVQVYAHNALDVSESDYQRSTMQSLYWGAGFAAFVWLAFVLVYVVTARTQGAGLWFGPDYGPVEFAIWLHTLWVGRGAIKRIYPIISIIQQAIAGQLRRETNARPD